MLVFVSVFFGLSLTRKRRNTAQFTLDLDDVNDNAPVFIQSHFEIYINENESTFPYGFRVEAFDRDLNGNTIRFWRYRRKKKRVLRPCTLLRAGSSNSEIRYSIVDGNAQGNFSIHPVTGELSVTHPLDFELLAPSAM